MIDIDSFKSYNDEYGHPVGDECLRRVAESAAHHREAAVRSGARRRRRIPLPRRESPAWPCSHLERDAFGERGYFPGVALRKDPPRLVLVALALDFHPSTESILQHFSPEIEVERIGLGIHLRGQLEVMFRLRRAEHPA